MSFPTRGEHQIGIVCVHMVTGTEGERPRVIGGAIGSLEFRFLAQFENRKRFRIDAEELNLPLPGMKVAEGNSRIILKNECRCAEQEVAGFREGIEWQ